MLRSDGRPEEPRAAGADLDSLLRHLRYESRPLRVKLRLFGLVQGVGFRPFLHALATRLALAGSVRNSSAGLCLEVEGCAAVVRALLEGLRRPPPLARIVTIRWEEIRPLGASGFVITPSSVAPEERGALPPPDAAPCGRCVAEVTDPADRRYRYPLSSCTDCGPRFTIVERLPYDRENTALRRFPLCAACAREFGDAHDRRFHAQPIACPSCGPQLELLGAGLIPLGVPEALSGAGAALRRGQIVALKGVGGFHLACAAASQETVARLRERKQRPEKPFALMVPDLGAARRLCEVSGVEEELLASRERPIVLLRPRPANGVAPAVSGGSALLGVMLPSSPLHELLLRDLGIPLVMTSGNRHGEPIETADPSRLEGIAEAFLIHERAILSPCDDSVARVRGKKPRILRRGRGFAPAAVPAPLAALRPLLAAGGQLKSTFTLAEGERFFPSQHLGDLDSLAGYENFEREVRRYESLLGIRPSLIAHDLHPDYRSSLWARERAAREGLATLAVQHHHAHFAACLAENQVCGPAIGVIFDGTGYGTDGAIWGGEFLVGSYESFERVAHFRPLALPGGSGAIRQPWRMALSWLADAGIEPEGILGEVRWRNRIELARRLPTGGAPVTTSAGRLFDALAALLTPVAEVTFEGQAALALEALATAGTGRAYPFAVAEGTPLVIDTRPTARAWAADFRRGASAADMAFRFHRTVAEAVLEVCCRIRERTGLSRAALSGGVFANEILADSVEELLGARDFEVFCHAAIPPNDGGISFGQAAVAAAALRAGGSDVLVGSR